MVAKPQLSVWNCYLSACVRQIQFAAHWVGIRFLSKVISYHLDSVSDLTYHPVFFFEEIQDAINLSHLYQPHPNASSTLNFLRWKDVLAFTLANCASKFEYTDTSISWHYLGV